MSEYDVNLSAFAESVYKSAEAEKDIILRELAQAKKERLEQIETDLLSQAYSTIKTEIESLRAEARKKVSDRELECRRELARRRGEIESEVFEAAKAKIAAFTASGEYEPYLTKKARGVAEIMGDAPIFLYMRKEDAELGRRLCALFKNAAFAVSDSILLGGFDAVSEQKHLNADMTFDTKLAEAHDKFKQNSGLMIED